MKNLLYITIGFILLLAACSTSTNDSPDHFGTWKVDTQTHATWEGTNGVQSIRPARFSTNGDSTAAPDTTYFYDNGQIQAEITPVSRDVYKGNFEFQITDHTSNIDLFNEGYNHVTALNLGDAFSVQGERGTTFLQDHNEYKIQMNFNCNSQKNNTGNLQLAVISVPNDDGIRDTLKVYELSTEGLYETARYVSCH